MTPTLAARAATLALILPLAQCIVVAPVEPYPGPDMPPECDLQAFQTFVGMRLRDARLVEGPYLRIIGPDSFVTEDHRPDRANVVHNRRGRIVEVYCG